MPVGLRSGESYFTRSTRCGNHGYQGLSDDFYAEQLRTPNLEKICQEMNIKTLIRYHEGYDHSYYFVSSFIGEHIAYHANKLNMR